MGRILVAGLINIETTVRVDGFPIEYTPVRYPFFGVNATVSGVGYNVAKALTVLGDPRVVCVDDGPGPGREDGLRAASSLDGIPHGFVIQDTGADARAR